MPEQKRPLKVFLCHAHVDKDAAKALHDRLVQDGVDAWLDKEKLFAGANWEFEIRKAVRDCDIFVVCVSQQFTQRSRRKNFSQTEVGIALNEAELKPKDQIYIIPVRLENCAVPKALQPWHWVDLFEPDGYQKLIRSLNKRIEELDAVEADKGQPGQGNISVVVSGDVSGNLIIGNQNKIRTNIPDEIAVQQKAEREAADKAALEKAEREAAERAAREKEERTKTKYLDIQDRVLEAAIEKEITVGNAAQLFVLIKQKDSKGIISIVNAIDEEVVLDESNVKTREIQIEFPVENYQRMPAELKIRLDAPDFHIPNKEKYILVPPDGDSEVSTFMVTPKRAGKLLINIEVLKGKNNLAAKTIRTTAIMADVRNKSFALFSLPLIVLAQPVSSLPTWEAKEMIAPQNKSKDLWVDSASQRQSRQIKVEHRVAIIVAIIGAIATILAALIGLLPQLFLPAPAPTATKTPTKTATFTTQPSATFTDLPPSQTPEPSLTPTQAFAPTPTPLPTEIVDAKGVTMRLVPAGEFIMGRNDASNNDQKPEHSIYLDTFYIDKYEVTNTQYAKCINEGGCANTESPYLFNPKFSNHPVVWVSWNRAVEFCSWRGARLPTEAEWEKSARGLPSFIEQWPNSGDYNIWSSGTTEVGLFPKDVSPYGVYDMRGNVLEWVADWYEANYYKYSPEINPLGPPDGEYRVIRGSSWNPSLRDTTIHPLTTNRHFGKSTRTGSYLGFRCARSP